MITIPNQSLVAKAFNEFNQDGTMKDSAYRDREVDVIEELFKFTLLTCDLAPWLTDRYSERRERDHKAALGPANPVHPEVLQAMREVGIDLEHVTPRRLTDEIANYSAILITMGCGEQCPHIPGLRRLDWPLEDPKGKPVERVRKIRAEVRALVSELLAAEGWL